MFSYLDIQFPTLDVPLHRAYSLNSTHARYEHETLTIYFLIWDVPSEAVSSGTPISITLSGFHSSRTINGYIHHITPDFSPDKKYVEVTVIGASYPLKQQGQKVWVNSTADMVVADIARKHNFSYIATPHPRVFEQISQAGMSDWELLVKLAKQCGYSFKANNTTLLFQPLTQEFTELRQQASYYALGNLNSKSTGVYSFKPLIGESIPYTDTQKSAPAVSGADRLTVETHANTPQKKLKGTRKNLKAPIFDVYYTNVVAPTFQIAKYESEAADERNRYAYRGEVVLPGNPNLIPDSPIFLDGLGNSYSGFWTVLAVEHSVEEHTYTTTALVGTDALGMASQWTDNKEITSPDEKIKRIISPGARQQNVIPITKLSKKGKSPHKGKTSSFSLVTNKAQEATTAPTYKWTGNSGNLRKPPIIDPKMPSFVLDKIGKQNG